MDFRKVTAIIRGDKLEKVEQRLHELRVPGISVTRVKGYGEYANFYTNDWMTPHARVEIFISARRADEIAQPSWKPPAPVRRATALWRCCRWKNSTRFVIAPRCFRTDLQRRLYANGEEDDQICGRRARA